MTTLSKLELLNVRRLPGRLSALDVAVLLGAQEHDIPVLVRAKLLKPLGNPAQSAPKWFSSKEILEKKEDREFLSKMTKVISENWKKRNAAIAEQSSEGSSDLSA